MPDVETERETERDPQNWRRTRGTRNKRTIDGEAYARAIVEYPAGIEHLRESFRDGTMPYQVLIHLLQLAYGTPRELTNYAITVANNGHGPGPDTAHQTTVYRLSPVA